MIYLCSYPKSGRTWVRFLLANYFNRLWKLKKNIDLYNVFTFVPNLNEAPNRGPSAFRARHSDMPKVLCTHNKANKINGKAILVTRNAFDVLVSYYYHQKFHVKQYHGNISKFIRHPQFGISNLIDYIKSWQTSKNICHISYEKLHKDPHSEMRKVINFLGIKHNPVALDQAISDSNFNNMLQKELTGAMLPGHKYNHKNANSRRVRSGKVGNFQKDLQPNDINYIQRKLKSLKDHYLYGNIKRRY